MPKLHFFIGKGGVGKTTVSAAYAVQAAFRDKRKSFLLLSTDPAHSLSDIFQQNLGRQPARVRLSAGAKLHVWQVDAERQFREFLKHNKEDMISILERGSIFSHRDIAPLLDSTLPGMAEISALLAVNQALDSQRYDDIVVDTAPFGHTLRLFELPEHFLRFLDFLDVAASRDQVLAAHFGGEAQSIGERVLAHWRKLVDGVLAAFAKDAELILVTTPETFSLNESLRCAATLGARTPPLRVNTIVLNRALLRSGGCRICRKKAQSTRAARALLRKRFPASRMYVAEDSGTPVAGVAGLRAFGDHVFRGKRLVLRSEVPPGPRLRPEATGWPVLGAPLALVLGKGGVGKTTISAALGFRTRGKARSQVEICSVDPAPSLDDIFQTEIGNEPKPVLGDRKFRASEMDSVAIFKDWAAHIKDLIDQATTANRAGIHVDFWFERQLFSRLLDSVPPGVDEILAVFRILDLLGHPTSRIIIDMAPTGHALDLLRTPQRILAWTRLLLKTLAAHRTLALAQDAGVKVAEVGHRVRELLDLLKNSKYTRTYIVMLPEYLPDRETERLLADLEGLNLSPRAMFVNRVLFPEDLGGCGHCRLAREWQLNTLARLRRRSRGLDIYVVRNFPEEISGKKALRFFTGELWRLA
ncbi:MAG TPA: ArsA family ATPase [Terriglobales bacterium]|nr:ArsA family ATPase [Terriglobales bacterium]